MKTTRLRLWFLEISLVFVKMKIRRSLLLGFIFFSFFIFAMVRVRGQTINQEIYSLLHKSYSRFLWFFPLPLLTGFISIDCGIPDGHNYTDNTNIFYVSDSQYIDTGINNGIASNYINNTIPIPDLTARSFPVGGRNCYTLKPVVTNRKYLLRATFMYGNYDGLQSAKANAFIAFDLHIGVNLWKTVNISDAATEYQVEAITVASADFISVCLINTNSGTPFISALELRPIKSLERAKYRVEREPNTSRLAHLPGLAAAPAAEQWAVISTTLPIKNFVNDSFEAPSAVLQTAVTPAAGNSTAITFLRWAPDSAADEHFLVFHFSELQLPTGNASRQFGIYVAGSVFWSGRPYTPPTLLSGYVYDPPMGPPTVTPTTPSRSTPRGTPRSPRSSTPPRSTPVCRSPPPPPIAGTVNRFQVSTQARCFVVNHLFLMFSSYFDTV
uniref:Malectin-like domain-containing protein n=1 Tax=Ananas comosus var. bracteatus TaxID=296719 RepID=A0A6V7PSY2_ANACO|nr:unnamed protein product [Ananas comosus var. bracteatus]